MYRYLLTICFLFSSLSAGYMYDVAACLIFQNEAPYLKEWIEYHKLIGIEHFYLINNSSTDDFREVLMPYIKSGLVELYHDATVTNSQAEYNLVQCGNYEKILNLARGKVKWLAIIDADEFIVPLTTNSLPKFLKRYEAFGGLYVNWLEFGTSHLKSIPQIA